MSCLWMSPPGYLSGRSINEIMQDYIERTFGIHDLFDAAIYKPIKSRIHDKNDLTASVDVPSATMSIIARDDFSVGQDIGRSFTIGGPVRGFFIRGDIVNANHPLRDHRGEIVSFMWNPQLIGISKSDFNYTFSYPSILFLITGPVILLFISFWVTLKSLFPQKTLKNLKFLVNIFESSYCMPFYFLAFVFWMAFFFIYFPAYRDYENSYKDTYTRIKQCKSYLDEKLNSTSDTSIVELNCLSNMFHNISNYDILNQYFFPLGQQEKNIHNGSAFISKQPFFPYNYIRINIDLFNYLFYAPKLTKQDLESINARMEYRNLGDGIWLGQYHNYVSAVKCLPWAYGISLLLWGIMIAVSLYKYIKILNKNRDTREKDIIVK